MLDKLKEIKRNILLWLSPKRALKIKRALPASLLIALMLSVVLLTIYHSTDGFTTLVDTEPAVIVNEKSSITLTGYTLRNETAVKSKYNGGVYYLAENGERVNPGDELARVYEEKTDEHITALAANVDRCISILEESIGDGKFTLGDKSISDRIQKIYYEMMESVASGDSSALSSNHDELLILLNKIQSYKGNTQKLSELLEEYKLEKSKLDKYYKGNYETLKAEGGGYYFRETDGYESVLSSDNIDELTYEGFFEMTEKPRSDEESIGKLMLDYRWYVVVPTVKGVSDTFSVGGEYEVTLPDSGNRRLTMELYRVVPDSTGARTLMVFSCGIVDGSSDVLRVQRVNIVNKNITGFRVPASAVCEHGGNSGVYIIKDGMASFRKIVILYEGDGYYIVSSDNTNSDGYYVYLEQNDRIITDSKNMYEGKVIE